MDWNVVSAVKPGVLSLTSYDPSTMNVQLAWTVPVGIASWALYGSTDGMNFTVNPIATYTPPRSSDNTLTAPQAPYYYRLIGTFTNGLIETYNDVFVQNSAGALDIVITGISTSGNAICSQVVAGENGSIIVAGRWNGRTDFGLGATNSTFSTQNDGFIAKYNTDGSIAWTGKPGGIIRIARSNGISSNSVKAVTVDSAFNIIVSGTFSDSTDFGGGTVTALSPLDGFVAKYSPDGTLIWVQHYARLTPDTQNGSKTLAVDSSDNIIAFMDCGFGADFGSSSPPGSPSFPMTPAGGAADFDLAFAKLRKADGVTVWAQHHGGVYNEAANAVAVDSSDNVVIAGSVNGPPGTSTAVTNLGGSDLPGFGSFDILVAKYSGVDGSYIWGKCFGGSASDIAKGITVGPNNVIIAGSANAVSSPSSGLAFNPGIFMAALSPVDGTPVWPSTVGAGLAGGGDGGQDVQADRQGNLVLCGKASDALFFGGNKSIFGNGQSNGFVVSFALPKGSNQPPVFKWIIYYGKDCNGNNLNGASNANTVALDTLGRVIVGGSFNAKIDFDNGTPSATCPHIIDGGPFTSFFVARYSN